MRLRTILAAACAAAMLSGAAVAQTNNSGANAANPSNSGVNSPDEEKFYTDNRDMIMPFFTDDSMTAMKSDDEVKSAFEAMGADTQAEMKTACERAAQNRGSYGSVTNALCDQVMAI